jgi:class 3 adenylate cyclase
VAGYWIVRNVSDRDLNSALKYFRLRRRSLMPDSEPPPPCRLPGSDVPVEFERLLDEMIDFPERRAAVEAHIHDHYSRRRAILVLDMCGFSRSTQAFGIVAFLTMIRRMRRICEPCFREHGGEFVDADADNLLYLFPSVPEALSAALEAQKQLARANEALPRVEHLFCAIGIGWGEVLCIGDGHIHGDEVNLAHKLGEDIATDGQILITAAAHTAVQDWPASREARVTISGIELVYHQIPG